MPRSWRRFILDGLPPVKQVATAVDFTGSRQSPAAYIDNGGDLWICDDVISPSPQKLGSVGNLSRVAIAPNRSVYCATTEGELLWSQTGSTPWQKIDIPNEKAADISVSVDGTVWVTMQNNRYYTFSPSRPKPQYHGVMINMESVCGVSGPNSEFPIGTAWGISSLWATNGLVVCRKWWNTTEGRDVRDLSVDYGGTVWLVKTDGTVWTTWDGRNFNSVPSPPLISISAGKYNVIFGVDTDGSSWVWDEETVPPPPPPTPPPPPPPPPQTRPNIQVTAKGGGIGTVFIITGSGFQLNANVTIKGARADGNQVINNYWPTVSTPSGAIHHEIPIPCIPGIQISFSANDGRPDPTDLTGVLWSNTTPGVCPPG